MMARHQTWRAITWRVATIVAAVGCCANIASAQTTLLQFSTVTATGSEASLASTTTAPGVLSGTLTRSSGLTPVATAGVLSSSGWISANDATTTFGTGRYYTFTVAPAANYRLGFTSITGSTRASSTGPNNAQWASSLDGFAAGLGTAVTPSTSGNTLVSGSLSTAGITSPTEFRLVGWRSTTGGQTGGTLRMVTPTISGSATLRAAATLTWDGGRGNGTWDSYNGYAAEQSNWDLNNLPSGSLVDSLTFAGATQTTTSNNVSGLTVGTIRFAVAAAAFVNSGSTITLNGDIINSSSNTQTILHAIALSTGSHAIDTSAGNVVIGGEVSGAGGSLTKTGPGTLTLTASTSFTGGLEVAAGRLDIAPGGSLAGGVTIAGILGGGGVIGGTIGGSGGVAPGASPGILTAAAVDPSGGIDHEFELTALGPNYTTTGSGALNDVLRLTAATPFTAPLSAAAGNAVNVYFNLASGSLSAGQTFVGGFFSDNAPSVSGLLTDVANAQFNYFVASVGGGTVHEGVEYRTLASWNAVTAQNLNVVVGGTAVANAAFPAGPATGYATTFAVVPEPSTLGLAGLCPVLAGWLAWRGRRPRGRPVVARLDGPASRPGRPPSTTIT
jgi:autotransporter-associated beta strand protein